jgi:hypothetical protein
MTMHHKVTVTLALFLTALIPVGAIAATAPKPKVVFYGDALTYNWTQAFTANPNWINKGAPTIYTSAAMDSALAGFQSEVVSLHPAIVHIMFGETDAEDMSPTTTQFYGPGLLADAQQMVAEAKAANIQVIFGLEPNALPQYKAIITMYGAAHNIPVIDYADALSAPGVQTFAGTGYNVAEPDYEAVIGTNGLLMANPNDTWPIASPTGQALMTQMAQAVISTMGLKLTGGYLQNVNEWQGYYTNVNSVSLFMQVQFTPYGVYTGGVVEPLLNANYMTQSTGTWTSSNPLVMQVDQQGHAWALTVGKTSISYTSPAGVHFSPWTMTVGSYDPQQGPSHL